MSSTITTQFPAEFRPYFSRATFDRGLQCFSQRKVGHAEWFEENGLRCIESDAVGSHGELYHVRVAFKWSNNRVAMFDTHCSCPVAYECKHAVATLLAVHQQVPQFLRGEEMPGPMSLQRAELQRWVDALQKASSPETAHDPNAFGPEEKRRLLYRLSVSASGAEGRLTVQTLSTSILKTGEFGQVKKYNIDSILSRQQTAKYIRPVDAMIAKKYRAFSSNYVTDTLIFQDEWGIELLRDMIGTGRCYWESVKSGHPPLTLGGPVEAEIGWKLESRGFQKPTFLLPKEYRILPLSPPWYVCQVTHSCGPLKTGMPDAFAGAWLNAPSIAPEQVEVLGEMLQTTKAAANFPAPSKVDVEVVDTLKPAPHLKLYSRKIKSRYATYGWYSGDFPDLTIHLAHVSVRYGDYAISEPLKSQEPVEVMEEGRLRRIIRDPEQEALAFAVLIEFGFAPPRAIYTNYELPENLAHDLVLSEDHLWLDFHQNLLPELEQHGWQIEIDPGFEFNLVIPDGWYSDAEEGGGMDWFGVELGVQIGDEKINLLPLLLDYVQKSPNLLRPGALDQIEENEQSQIRLSDGRLLMFPKARLREMLGVLLELHDEKALDADGRLKMSRLRAAELADMEDSNHWRWLGGTELKELREKVRSFSGITKVEMPRGLRASLRDYQKTGLNWLQFLREYELGGILADDMGLGKTVQTLAHLQIEKEAGRADRPSLVVAPTSLMSNWRQEAEKFTPGLKVLVLHGKERKEDFAKINDHDLIVTSYPLLPRDEEIYRKHQYHLVVLDEAQYIKNPKTKYAQAVCQLKTRHRLCLTGTPMENHLGELWSQFQYLMPGFLGDSTRFRSVFRNPIEKGHDEQRKKLLASRVNPFILRRKKEDVLTELPPKTEIVQKIELSAKQRDLYETIRLAMDKKVRDAIAAKGVSRSHIVILDALLKLRQVCCHPQLLKLASAKKVTESAKLDLLMDLLPEMISEGRRVLLFSQFTSMLALIEDKLSKVKIDYVQLTGQTRDRATPVNRFQNGEVPLFLISLKAGGTGLNLTTADTVIHYDPWWNPAVENQATDRAHRIGQDKNVFVYRFLTIGTVEERIAELQQRKRELVEGLLNSNGKANLKLTSGDLDVLFAPLEDPTGV